MKKKKNNKLRRVTGNGNSKKTSYTISFIDGINSIVFESKNERKVVPAVIFDREETQILYELMES
jgi:ribosomal protein S4E